MYNATNVTFANAVASCPFGTHVVTFNAPNSSASRLYDTVLGLSNYFVNQTVAWLGCSQAWAQPYKNYGWSWIDGTSASNLYNGTNNVTGWGLWNVGEPK